MDVNILIWIHHISKKQKTKVQYIKNASTTSDNNVQNVGVPLGTCPSLI